MGLKPGESNKENRELVKGATNRWMWADREALWQLWAFKSNAPVNFESGNGVW